MIQRAPTPIRLRRAAWTLQVAIRTSIDGPVLAREPVSDGDLGDMKSELWMRRVLRRGRPGVPLEAMPRRIVPRFGAGRDGNVITGYRLETTIAGQRRALAFTPSSLEPVALRAVKRLIIEEKLPRGARVIFEVSATCRDDAAAKSPSPPADDVIIREIPRPLEYLTAPIQTLREDARPFGRCRPRDFPAFFTSAALIDASRHARRGSAQSPPVESGAALLGVLCSCPRTGEFFAVVCAAVPIEDAAEERLSLTLSARSWDRIDSALDDLRRRYGTPATRLLGQGHSHPFKPFACERPDEFDHTAYVSRDDIAWSRAVFAREPYQLAHIFGKDASGGDVHALYGLRNGTLAWRGFSVIPRFPV
jgi:hypothetical protein